jgi:CHAD domain-containing protein
MRFLAIQHAISRRVRALARHLPAALENDAEGVHHARVASRRLRELLAVLAASANGDDDRAWRKLRSRVRRLTRALGTARELDVTLGVLDDLARAHAEFEPAIAAARAVAEEERRSQRAAMLEEVSAIGGAALAGDLDAAAARLDLRASAARAECLRRRLAVRVDNLESAIDAGGSLYVAERLHAVRIAVKQLRYVLELVHEIGRVPVLRLIGRLKQAQDVLGRLHDLQVAESYVRRAATTVAIQGGTGPLLRAIDVDTRTLHAAYLGLVSGLRETIVVCRERVDARLSR